MIKITTVSFINTFFRVVMRLSIYPLFKLKKCWESRIQDVIPSKDSNIIRCLKYVEEQVQ